MSDIWEDRRVKIGYEPAEELAKHAHKLNWRGHPEGQANATNEALDSLGWIDEIKVNVNTGNVFNGHLRISLALAKDPSMSLPVDYYDLTPDEELLALQVLDATTEMAEPIADKLAALMERTRGLVADKPGLAAMLEGLRVRAGVNGDGQLKGIEPQIDKMTELQEVWGTQVGQVWELGQHRLICGDCMDKAIIEAVTRKDKIRFEFSDPPYEMGEIGGGIVGHSAARHAIAQANLDKFNPSDLQFLALTTLFCCNKPLVPEYIDLAKKSRIAWDICFYKKENTIPNTNGHLMTDTEYLMVLGNQSPNSGLEKELYSKAYLGRPDENSVASWVKPVGLVEKFVRLYSLVNDFIFDRYSGSGTTLIVCENLSRKCRAIELDPGYCAVSIQRWVDLTQQQPKLISE